MPELERTVSGRSWRRQRAISRPSQPTTPQLERLYSVQHLDDQSYYHHNEHHGCSNDDQSISATDNKGDDQTKDEKAGSENEEEEEGSGLGGGSLNGCDLEVGRQSLEKKATTRSAKDEYMVSSAPFQARLQTDPGGQVTWDGPDDSANPKNWTFKRKWAATFIVSSFTFISPVSSSMVAPALGSLAKELNIVNEFEIALTLSIFVLAYAIGPLFLGPMSEIYGRVPVLQLANIFYLVFNIACGVCTSKGQMLAFRFLSGLGGSAPLAVNNAPARYRSPH